MACRSDTAKSSLFGSGEAGRDGGRFYRRERARKLVKAVITDPTRPRRQPSWACVAVCWEGPTCRFSCKQLQLAQKLTSSWILRGITQEWSKGDLVELAKRQD